MTWLVLWRLQTEFTDLCRMVNNGKPMFPGMFNKAMEEFDQCDD